MLSRAAFAPLHTSELASALGTLEMTDGTLRRAKELFRDALRVPTDNALAQAQWAHERQASVSRPTREAMSTPRSYEARSQFHRSRGEWEAALLEASKWLYDEPFSRVAAGCSSYLAGVALERYDESARLASIGLLSARRDPLLLNNLAFALASDGKLSAAEEAFQQVPPEAFDADLTRVALLATRGLLFYRRGNLVEGRAYYEQAIAAARKQKNRLSVALASLYHAREALYAASPLVDEIWARAQADARGATQPEIPLLQSRVEPPKGGSGESRRRSPQS